MTAQPQRKTNAIVRPENFVAFYVDGGQGLNIRPNKWHEAVFPLAERAGFMMSKAKCMRA